MRRHPLVPLYGQNLTNNYRGAPIDELGEESATYAAIRRVQLLFHRRYGTLMNRLRHEKTYHFCKAYGGYPLYSTYDLPHLRKAVSDHGLPGIVSSFTDEEGNRYFTRRIQRCIKTDCVIGAGDIIIDCSGYPNRGQAIPA